jgi:hypothetical protein
MIVLVSAYLLAQFRRAEAREGGPRACTLIAIDLFGEVDPTILDSDSRLFLMVVRRDVGHDFEDACRYAIQSCADDPRLAWMLEYLAPRSRHYLPEGRK